MQVAIPGANTANVWTKLVVTDPANKYSRERGCANITITPPPVRREPNELLCPLCNSATLLKQMNVFKSLHASMKILK